MPIGARDGRVAPVLHSLSEVAEVIKAELRPDRRMVVGIVGAPGSGKSTIAAELVRLLEPNATVLPMDGFHLPQAELVRLGRRQRMGSPDTFDVGGFLSTVASIRGAFGSSGQHVTAPGFDRETEEPIPGALDISPEFPCVIVEGNYLLLDSGGWEATAGLLDASFFVEIDEDIRLQRLIARHERFGKTSTDARAWALGPDADNARIIEATAARADYRIALR